MSFSRIFASLLFVFPLIVHADDGAWASRQITSQYHAECAAAGDLNGDGKPDIVYGACWFAGPAYATAIRYAAAGDDVHFKELGLTYIRDFDGDGDADILAVGIAGAPARLYWNPGKTDSTALWEMSVVVAEIGGDKPQVVDLIVGGLPEIVCSNRGRYGFYTAGTDVRQPWIWTSISAPGAAPEPHGNGLGVADMNRDGRLDVLENRRWFAQPASLSDQAWTVHTWCKHPVTGGSRIVAYDFDADGDADIVASLDVQGYDLSWFEQTAPGEFQRREILGSHSTDNPFGVVMSQAEACALADVNGDGRMDFAIGKRHMARDGDGPGALQETALYWFENAKVATGGIEFIPHLVHSQSGAGLDLLVSDLNADQKSDIVSANKLGLTFHTQGDLAQALQPERWKVPGGRPQEGYGKGMTADEALKRTEVPPGFSVDLIAAEPRIVQPIAMNFDARGRLWIIEGLTYPQRAKEGEGQDRIVILEDRDRDGSFESKKLFVDKVNLGSGIQIGFGGVFVGAAPYLHFYADADGDDVPDGAPEILLDGWGYQDTHETLNSFTWGPDGWLYGCQGVFTESRVGRPGTPAESRHKMNAGVWRFHPLSKKFEVFAHGTSNPWGLDFNAQGDFFISACVIPHFYHVIQGARYIRQGNAGHYNPYTFGEIQTIADHAHYVGSIADHSFWGKTKDNAQAAPSDTSALGGGHAHCGLVFYHADVFPRQFRGEVFFHNLHGHRMVREHLETNGSGYVARHRPDFMLSHNHDYVGVSALLGPDGALYYSDWVDPQTCHHRDVAIWDRANGRIFRVRYGAAQSTALELAAMSDVQLVTTLAHNNAFHARQAQRLLMERAAKGALDAAATRSALDALEKNHASDAALRLRSFWASHAAGLVQEGDLLARLNDPDPHIRGWALHFLGNPAEPLSAAALSAVESLAASESSSATRRYMAALLQRIPAQQRWTLAGALSQHAVDRFDPNVPFLVWYGIEPLVEVDPARAFDLAAKGQWPVLREYVARRAAVTPVGRAALMDRLASAGNAGEYCTRANDLLLALAKLPPVERPEGWSRARQRGESLQQQKASVMDVVRHMGVRFRDADFFPYWQTLATNPKEPAKERIYAMELLQAGGDPALHQLSLSLLDDSAMTAVAIRSLRGAGDEKTADALVQRLAAFPLHVRNEAINLLATRQTMALRMLQAVDEKTIAAQLISPVMLDQFERFQNKQINAIIHRNWARGGGAVDIAKLTASIETWKKKLSNRIMEKADAARGRQVYNLTCGACHQLFGQGVALGPDLTGSNRADLGYVLENVLAPSAVVGRDYMLNIFTMNDGAVVSGMVRGETQDFFTVVMPGGTSSNVRKSDLKERQEMATSLMPAGLFDTMPIDQVADLIKYLGSAQQVALPDKP